MARSQLLRASAPLSPLPPQAYIALSNSLTADLSSGKYLRSKPAPKEDDLPANPFEAGNLEGAMEGMKKQAVMMSVGLLCFSLTLDGLRR